MRWPWQKTTVLICVMLCLWVCLSVRMLPHQILLIFCFSCFFQLSNVQSVLLFLFLLVCFWSFWSFSIFYWCYLMLPWHKIHCYSDAYCDIELHVTGPLQVNALLGVWNVEWQLAGQETKCRESIENMNRMTCFPFSVIPERLLQRMGMFFCLFVSNNFIIFFQSVVQNTQYYQKISTFQVSSNWNHTITKP